MQKSKPLKVIAFDGWTQGSHHYQRLLPAFRNNNLELTLIHLGSWGDDPGRPQEEVIGGLRVRDISFYGGKSFLDILDVEQPAAVVFLSTDTFLHRAFNRYCRYRGVPTVHLFHGIRRIVDFGVGVPYEFQLGSYLKFAFSRLPRALRHVWPTYSAALWKTKAGIREWGRFARDVVCGALGMIADASAADARTDRICIYIGADLDCAVDTYGVTRDKVVIVGNPDLTRFGLSSDIIGSCLARPEMPRPNVMYVDGAFISTGLVFDSEQEFIQHVIYTRDQLAEQGKRLVFKPHPGHSTTGVLPALEKAGMDISTNEAFIPTLQGCCACIAEPSSLTVLTALTGIPLFLVNYGKMKQQSFGEILTSYPRARRLLDASEFNSVLAAEQAAYDSRATLQWIEQNAGPLPAEGMPDRVAGVVASLINAGPDRKAI